MTDRLVEQEPELDIEIKNHSLEYLVRVTLAAPEHEMSEIIEDITMLIGDAPSLSVDSAVTEVELIKREEV